MNVGSAYLWGFAATVILTTAILTGQSLGITRLDLPFVLGTMVTMNRDRAKIIGYVMHVVVGFMVAFVYTIFFQAIGHATWWIGMLLGLVHGTFVAVAVLPLLPGIHPRMVSDSRGPEPTRLLEPPGFLATNYGRNTPLVLLVSHALYGIILGAFYVM